MDPYAVVRLGSFWKLNSVTTNQCREVSSPVVELSGDLCMQVLARCQGTTVDITVGPAQPVPVIRCPEVI
jgi:hypothetical protein